MTHTAKHTPGPWYPHLAKADHCLSSSVWGAEPGNQVAVIGGKSLETMNANAHLIAAAPAMYGELSVSTNLLCRALPYLPDAVAKELVKQRQINMQVLSQAEGR